MPDAAAAAPAAVREYADRHEALTEAGAAFVALVTSILDDAGINYLSVTGRTKSVASFAAKAARRQDGELLYADPLRDITDQIGVRVITYVHSDVAVVADLLADQVVVQDDRDLGRETASQGRFGYASRHLVIALDAARESQPAYEPLRGLVASAPDPHRAAARLGRVRARHPLQGNGSGRARAATSTAGSRSPPGCWSWPTGSSRRSATGSGSGPPSGPSPRTTTRGSSPRELAAFLAGQYADAGWSRTDHYAWISGLLLELAITSLDELGDVLRPIDELDLNARMDYRYPPGAVRRLDDALLAAFGEALRRPARQRAPRPGPPRPPGAPDRRRRRPLELAPSLAPSQGGACGSRVRAQPAPGASCRTSQVGAVTVIPPARWAAASVTSPAYHRTRLAVSVVTWPSSANPGGLAQTSLPVVASTSQKRFGGRRAR